MRRVFWQATLLVTLLSLMLAPAALAGTLAGLAIAANTPADGITGFAYDPATGSLYTSINYGQSIVGPDGTVDIYATGSLLDMAFAGGFIWAGEGNAAGGSSLVRIDPETGNVKNEYNLGSESLGTPAAPVPFMASGVAWDGSKLWVSNNSYSPEALAPTIYGTSIAAFSWNPGSDTIALISGSLFTPWPDTLTAAGRTPGGLAWDSKTGQLLVGTDSGEIYSFNPSNPGGGMTLYATTAGGFVQGLETAPEPASYLLFGSALLGLLAVHRRKRAE
jgi:hypothetical protein